MEEVKADHISKIGVPGLLVCHYVAIELHKKLTC